MQFLFFCCIIIIEFNMIGREVMKEENFSFTRTNTKAIKGIAILLMLIHHLWGFPERIYGGYLFHFIKNLYLVFGSFGKICVSIFFFVGGYGLYEQSKKGNINLFKNIKKLYISYWKVFLIFIPIGFIYFADQIPYCSDSVVYSVFANFDLNNVLNNFLGFSNSLNREWWFIIAYLFAIISFPFFKKVFDKYGAVSCFFVIIIFSLLNTYIFPSIGELEVLGNMNQNFLYRNLICNSNSYFCSFLMGIVFSKDNLFNEMHIKINEAFNFNIISSFFIIIISVYLRYYVLGATCDFIIVPFLIYSCLYILRKFKFLNNIFIKIGNQSTNMWLSHSFLCYYFYPFAKLVVAPKWCVSSLILFVVLSYFVSLCIDAFWKKINNLYVLLKR